MNLNLNQPENMEEIAESNLQVFNEVKKAYGYLTNTITKLIYDQYGIPGLIMYDKHTENFDELLREMIRLNSLPDIYKDTLFEK
jgi:DnaJ-class molecular chaperone